MASNDNNNENDGNGHVPSQELAVWTPPVQRRQPLDVTNSLYEIKKAALKVATRYSHQSLVRNVNGTVYGTPTGPVDGAHTTAVEQPSTINTGITSRYHGPNAAGSTSTVDPPYSTVPGRAGPLNMKSINISGPQHNLPSKGQWANEMRGPKNGKGKNKGKNISNANNKPRAVTGSGPPKPYYRQPSKNRAPRPKQPQADRQRTFDPKKYGKSQQPKQKNSSAGGLDERLYNECMNNAANSGGYVSLHRAGDFKIQGRQSAPHRVLSNSTTDIMAFSNVEGEVKSTTTMREYVERQARETDLWLQAEFEKGQAREQQQQQQQQALWPLPLPQPLQQLQLQQQPQQQPQQPQQPQQQLQQPQLPALPALPPAGSPEPDIYNASPPTQPAAYLQFPNLYGPEEGEIEEGNLPEVDDGEEEMEMDLSLERYL